MGGTGKPDEGLRRVAPLYQQVADSVRRRIHSGELKHGQPLPSTQELAREWQVSVHTISEAMAVLTEEGLLISRDRSMRLVNHPWPADVLRVSLREDGTVEVWQQEGRSAAELAAILRSIADGFDGDPKRIA